MQWKYTRRSRVESASWSTFRSLSLCLCVSFARVLSFFFLSLSLSQQQLHVQWGNKRQRKRNPWWASWSGGSSGGPVTLHLQWMYSLIYSYSVTQVMSKRVEKLNSSIVALSRPSLLHEISSSSSPSSSSLFIFNRHCNTQLTQGTGRVTPFTSLHLHCTRLLILLLLLLKHESNLPSLLWQTAWYKRNDTLL